MWKTHANLDATQFQNQRQDRTMKNQNSLHVIASRFAKALDWSFLFPNVSHLIRFFGVCSAAVEGAENWWGAFQSPQIPEIAAAWQKLLWPPQNHQTSSEYVDRSQLKPRKNQDERMEIGKVMESMQNKKAL